MQNYVLLQCIKIALENVYFVSRTLGARIAQMTEPRRPLKPIRKERKKIGGQVSALFIYELIFTGLWR